MAVTLISTPRATAVRHGNDSFVERHPKVEVDVEVVVEEAVDIPVVERFGAQDMGARLETGDDEVAVLGEVNPPTSFPVFGLNATTCAPCTPRPAFVTRPLMLPNCRENVVVP